MDIDLAQPSEKSILVVEDDDSMRDFLEITLRKEGFAVAGVVSGDQALGSVAKSAPDLVLLDLMLPGKGGYEVFRKFQEEGLRSLIVVMTARRMDRETVAMLKQEPNVAEFLEKPVKAQVLAATVHRLLKTRPPELG